MAGLQHPEETIITVSKTTLENARNNLTALGEYGLTADALDAFETDI